MPAARFRVPDCGCQSCHSGLSGAGLGTAAPGGSWPEAGSQRGSESLQLLAWRSPDLADSLQGISATFLCQPLDVLKTRLMNSHGEYRVSGPPYPPCCCLSSCLCTSFCHPAPPTSSLTSHSRVSSTVPRKLPSSARLPSTRYLAGGAWGGPGWAEQSLWSTTVLGQETFQVVL